MKVFMVSIIVGFCGCAALAQNPDVPFKPGEWKVNLTMVLNNGKTMNSQTQLCLANPEDAWQQKRADQVCGPVQLTPAGSGAIRVQIHCKGGASQIVTEMHIDMLAHFSSNGESYTESGTSTSSTTILGRPPLVMNIATKEQGTRIGACTTPAKP